MLPSKEKLSTKAMAKLGRARTIAALSVAAVTAGAAMAFAESTSVASVPASSTLEAQLQIVRECDDDSNYSREDSLECLLEGTLGGFACGCRALPRRNAAGD